MGTHSKTVSGLVGKGKISSCRKWLSILGFRRFFVVKNGCWGLFSSGRIFIKQCLKKIII